MQHLKILVDCHVFDNGFQGTTTYLKGLYSELIKDQAKHFYLVANDIPNLKKEFGSHKNVFYIAYKSKNKFVRLLVEIPNLIKTNKIDFAHFQYIVSPIKRCKYIVTTHDVLFIDFPQYFPVLNRIKNTFLYKWSAKSADVLLTVSDYSKERIQYHFGIDKIHITPNAVDEAFFENYDKEKIGIEINKKFNLSNYMIYVSRWEPRKNHQLLLRSFVEKRLYEKYQLLFIGDTTFINQEYENYYRNLDFEIKSKIVSLQKLDFKTMLLLLRGAKVALYPSIAEGFGIPPLESLAAGIPTISSHATAMSDFDFLNEYLFDPFNQMDFEAKLEKAFQMDKLELYKIQQIIKEKYSWYNAAQVYNQAILDYKKGLKKP